MLGLQGAPDEKRRKRRVADLEPHIVTEKPRTLARRRQVLEAASRCFRRHGFHACSMAQISAEAGMSVGHIYRYFTGKEAIIAAIVREDVDEILCKVANFPKDGTNLRAALTERADEGVMRASDPEQAALMIEIRAEAARNPSIRVLVKEADEKISAELRTVIAGAVDRKLTKADLEARVEMFQLIFQGIGLRTIINPSMDRRALSQIVKLTIDAILK
jgi:AcrR family transcriptional regulator